MTPTVLKSAVIKCFAAAAVSVAGCAAAATAGEGQAATSRPASFFPDDEKIRDMLRSEVDEGKIKGFIIGLIEADGSRRVVAYGSAGKGARPLGAKSVFDIASISKTFTGAILADMVLNGEVSLNDPVSKFLPASVRVPSRNGKTINILDLATHRSGLPAKVEGYKPPDPDNFFAELDVQWLYKYLSRRNLALDPGSGAVYSNVGYALLGHVLAKAAGTTDFETLARQRILHPLGMKLTDFQPSAELRPWMTKGHDGERQMSARGMKVFSSSGGLMSTIEDMLNYLDANMGAPNSSIERAMRDAHKARADLPVPNVQMALGWGIMKRDEQDVVMSAGGSAGYSSFIALDPARRVGVVILSNSSDVNSTIEAVALDLLRPSGP